VAVDAAGDVFFGDYDNNAVDEVRPDGTTHTIASGFNLLPFGVAVDAAGDVFFGDYDNNAVDEVRPDGTTHTIGSGFFNPDSVAVDAAGDVFFADFLKHAVDEILPDGTIKPIGSGFNRPNGVAVDAAGDVFVADSANHAVYEVLPGGTTHTLASGFNQPYGVAVDAAGDVFFSDATGKAVYEILPDGTTHTLASALLLPDAVAVDAAGDVFVANYDDSDVVKLQGPPVVAATPTPLTGTTATAVSAALTGLSPGTTYYYRAVASSAAGLVGDGHNPPLSFETPALLSSLSTITAVEGSAAFTLTLTGSGFHGTAIVLWDGTPLTTHFDSATPQLLEAFVPAALLAEEGSASVAVTQDGTTSAALPFTITDATLSSLTINTPGATQGIGFSSFTVATFTDANTAAPASDFTATVSWGDGTTSTLSGAAASLVAEGGGLFALLAGHIYTEAGSFTLAVQISDDGGSSLAGTQTLSVADHPLANLSILAPSATEGKNTNLLTVATFTDFLGAPTADFTALVHWGDTTTSTVSGAGILAGSGGGFKVQAAHTYAEEGSFTLAVQVLDEGGASLSASQAVTVADAGLTNLGVSNPSATEGIGTATFTVATFADKNAAAPLTDFTATVSWGDGSSSTARVVRTGTGTFAVLASHTYAEEANATLAVQIRDDGGASVSLSRAIAVADAPLTGLGLQNPHAIEGLSTGTVIVATFTDTNASAPASDFTATISWGDSSSTTVSAGAGVVALGGGVFAVQAAHTYAQAGNYVLSVQVLDTGGASVRGSRGVDVATPTLTNLTLSNLQPTEAKGIGLIRVASFHDSNLAVPVTDFTATITWGDGTTTTLSGAAGTIRAVGNGWFYLLANHTYAEEGNYTLAVQVRDTGGDRLSGSRAVAVADARLTGLGLSTPHATVGHGTGTFTVATFHDANAAAPTADFTALVHWGDGGTSTLSGLDIVAEGNGTFAVLASHTYATSGTYTLSVQVLDDGGASLSASHTLTVAP
jgi:hypothetical protein